MPRFAGVAQLVEQRIRNAKVGSSTLLTGTNKFRSLRDPDPGVLLPTIRGIFSDWPATVTYYANCMNKK